MKSLDVSRLLDFYGTLLTEKQRDMLDEHYNMDFSLAEIAENYEISRQAAQDAIVRGREKLLNYEVQLGLFQKYCDTWAAIDKMEQISNNSPEMGEVIQKLKDIWKES